MIEDLQSFYLSQEEPNRGCLLALRTIILAQDGGVTETRKYGMPCFCYGKKAFTYLWVDNKSHEPYMLMVEGKHLNHPQLEQGKRSRMKVFRVNPLEDLDIHSIQEVLQHALELYKSGKLKMK